MHFSALVTQVSFYLLENFISWSSHDFIFRDACVGTLETLLELLSGHIWFTTVFMLAYDQASIHFKWRFRTEIISVILCFLRDFILINLTIVLKVLCFIIPDCETYLLLAWFAFHILVLVGHGCTVGCQTYGRRLIDALVELWHESISVHWWSRVWIVANCLIIGCSVGSVVLELVAGKGVWLLLVYCRLVWFVQVALVCIGTDSFA